MVYVVCGIPFVAFVIGAAWLIRLFSTAPLLDDDRPAQPGAYWHAGDR